MCPTPWPESDTPTPTRLCDRITARYFKPQRLEIPGFKPLRHLSCGHIKQTKLRPHKSFETNTLNQAWYHRFEPSIRHPWSEIDVAKCSRNSTNPSGTWKPKPTASDPHLAVQDQQKQAMNSSTTVVIILLALRFGQSRLEHTRDTYAMISSAGRNSRHSASGPTWKPSACRPPTVTMSLRTWSAKAAAHVGKLGTEGFGASNLHETVNMLPDRIQNACCIRE